MGGINYEEPINITQYLIKYIFGNYELFMKLLF